MSKYIEVVVLVEGTTEKIFINDILSPYLASKNIFMTPIIISKPGQKGGDVRFIRVKNDLELHLKQRKDTYISLFVDYYGINKDWPGLDAAKSCFTPKTIADAVNSATKRVVTAQFREQDAENRFIPFIAVHEFEALLFSDIDALSKQLQIDKSSVEIILKECKEPENINNSPHSAPSKRLELLYSRYKKTTTGITIAKAIGIETMRRECPLFNGWLTTFEELQGTQNGKA